MRTTFSGSVRRFVVPLVGLVAYVLVFGFLCRANPAGEEMKDLIFVQALTAGKKLYTEFDWMYGPLYPHALTAFFQITSLPLEILTVRYLAVGMGAAGYLGAYLMARTLLGKGWSSVAAFVACSVFLPPAHTYNHHLASGAILVGLGALAVYFKAPSLVRIAALALVSTVPLLTKPIPLGLAQLLFVIASFFVMRWKRSGRYPLIHLTAFGTIVMLIVGISYAAVFRDEGTRTVLWAMRPQTLEGEHLSVHFVPPFLHPEALARTWGPLANAEGRTAAQALKIIDELCYSLDYLAVLVGLTIGVLGLRRSGTDPGRLILLLSLGAYLFDTELLTFGRQSLFSGARAPALLLQGILLGRFVWPSVRWDGADPHTRSSRRPDVGTSSFLSSSPHGGRSEAERGAGLRSFGAGTLVVLVLLVLQARIAYLRGLPVFASQFMPSSNGYFTSRFAAEVRVPGLRGLRVLEETRAHYQLIDRELKPWVERRAVTATWGVPGFVGFRLGSTNIQWNKVHSSGPIAAPPSGYDRMPDAVFLENILPLSDPTACSQNPWPKSASLGYRVEMDACAGISRTYVSRFVAYAREAQWP